MGAQLVNCVGVPGGSYEQYSAAFCCGSCCGVDRRGGAAGGVESNGWRVNGGRKLSGGEQARAASVAAANGAVQQVEQRQEGESRAEQAPEGKISAETRKALGLTRVANPAEASARMAQKLRKKTGSGDVSIQSGQPTVFDARSALSAALITTIGGRDNQFSEVTLIADWDGREDCAADREQKVDDFSFSESDIDTR